MKESAKPAIFYISVKQKKLCDLVLAVRERLTDTSKWRHRIIIGATFIFGCWGNSMGGDKFSNQGNVLHKALIEELVKQKVCEDHQSCFNILQMYREDGDRIYLNMYAQTDKRLSTIVAKFIVEKGLGASNGMPITLRIYSSPKSFHLGFKSIFNKDEETIKLEVNK